MSYQARQFSESELKRRRLVWIALSDLFLDTTLGETDYRHIAKSIVASGYAPGEIHSILWNEVFPAVECNLRSPAGEWGGFDPDWLQERILAERTTTKIDKLTAALAFSGPASIIRNAWAELLLYLPDNFRD